MFNPVYIDQVKLLLRILPLIQQHDCFALKGGTAMNLFVQDLPRLSVDIDLAYLPLVGRDQALSEIAQALELLSGEIESAVPSVSVAQLAVGDITGRLVVSVPGAMIKIEPNLVFRGALHEVETHVLCPTAQAVFEQFVESRILSVADLYGGKICAALDRQHPRDLFDVHLMFENIRLSDEIRQAFVVYLAGHPRPMAELLNPNEQPLDEIFKSQFDGMSRAPVSVDLLNETRTRLVRELNDTLTENERLFLLSMKTGEPEWQRIPIKHLDLLPALQWKLRNVARMEAGKHRDAVNELKRVLGL